MNAKLRCLAYICAPLCGFDALFTACKLEQDSVTHI